MFSHRNQDLFNAYYGAPGFKFQFMTSPCGIIEDVSGPYGGAINDAEMARRSQLQERMASFCNVPQMRIRDTHMTPIFACLWFD
eukprot:33715-Eustigmatos_ZCMA.PRE.1